MTHLSPGFEVETAIAAEVRHVHGADFHAEIPSPSLTEDDIGTGSVMVDTEVPVIQSADHPLSSSSDYKATAKSRRRRIITTRSDRF